MAYATASDSLLHFVRYVALAVFLATLLLLASIAVIRFMSDRKQAAERRLIERWQPVFFLAIDGSPVVAPDIADNERETILRTWLYLSESVRGEARHRLRQLANDLRFEQTAGSLLRQRRLRSRQLAIAALGRMKRIENWNDLASLADDDNASLSILAVRSLLQIDVIRGLPLLFQRLGQREDWPLTKLAAMLGEVPPDERGDALTRTIATAGTESLPRLLNLAALVPAGNLWPVLAPLLDGRQPEAILIAALKASADPRCLEPVRQLAAHDLWTVRAQAAITLGRLGLADDRLRLQAMLADREWWVRYRAAQALVRLPSSRRTDLEALCERIGDRFAADMLRQALAEAHEH